MHRELAASYLLEAAIDALEPEQTFIWPTLSDSGRDGDGRCARVRSREAVLELRRFAARIGGTTSKST
jgi:hypothetical protein